MSARNLLLLLLACIALRLVTLGTPDLIDTTEGRYANISRVMAESGNWVTPMIQMKEELVPYLGKPPLYFWAGAAAMDLFGASNWSARLPSFIAALIILVAIATYTRRFIGGDLAVPACLVALSSAFLYFLSGGVIVDAVLTACLFLGFVSSAFFAEAALRGDRGTARIYGVGLGICGGLGFLTKGPVALVLLSLPIFIIGLLTFRKGGARAARLTLVRSFPWILSFVAFLLISVPWFVYAERQNPGFAEYFFVNENFLRFVTRNYQDRFGTGHVYPYGTVWLVLALAMFPWVLIALVQWVARLKGPATGGNGTSPWVLYALAAGLSPAIFFTLARQFSPVYVLPGVPGLAVFLTSFLSRKGWSPSKLSVVSLSIIVVYSCVPLFAGRRISEARSTKAVLQLARDHFGKRQVTLGVPFGNYGNPFSVWFYNEVLPGTPPTIRDATSEPIANGAFDAIVMQKRHAESFAAELAKGGYTRTLVTSPKAKWLLYVK